MTALIITVSIVALLFIVKGILDICRDLDRSDMSENDE